MSDDAQILANHLITLSIVDYDDVFVKSATELRRLDALVKEQAQEIDELRKANEAFAKRQVWWNDRMFELEQELERLRAQRVPLTEAERAELEDLRRFRDGAFLAHTNIDIDIKAVHPFQRLADLSKEIGEKL